MARKPNQLGDEADALIKTHMARGGSAESIAKALERSGVVGASRATVGRRMRELRGKVRAGRVTTKPASTPPPLPPEPVVESEALVDPPLPASAEEIPEGLSLALLYRLRAKAEAAGEEALARKDLATFGAMGRLVTAVSEAIRKATPPTPPDPNEQPDMLALAKQVRERLHELLDKVVA